MQTEIQVVVSEAELDELGHVNNARYLDFLESGRMDWYGQVGLMEALEVMHNSVEFGTVVVNINIDFHQECLLGDALTIETKPKRLGRKSLVLHQTMKKPSGDIAAEAAVTSVVLDLSSRAAIVLPNSLEPFFPSASSS